MTLTYRGINYQTSELKITTSKSKFTGTYRGQSYQLNHPLYLANKLVENLIYRGVKQSPVVKNNPVYVIADSPAAIN